jgi:hypothetical protein
VHLSAIGGPTCEITIAYPTYNQKPNLPAEMTEPGTSDPASGGPEPINTMPYMTKNKTPLQATGLKRQLMAFFYAPDAATYQTILLHNVLLSDCASAAWIANRDRPLAEQHAVR